MQQYQPKDIVHAHAFLLRDGDELVSLDPKLVNIVRDSITHQIVGYLIAETANEQPEGFFK